MILTRTYIEQILTHYDLGTLHQAMTTEQGNVNETVVIQTDAGQFVLRHNRPPQRERLLRYRHTLMTCLHTHGFALPRLIPTRDGETLLQLDRGWYEIQEFIAGEDYDPDRFAQVASIGTILARYHTVVRACPAPAQESQPRYSPARILGLIERVMEADVMGDLLPSLSWYDLRISQMRKTLSETQYAQLPHCVIHGDMHQNNLRFVDDEAIALLDYDQVAWDARLVDLVDALISFASVTAGIAHSPRGVFAGPLNLERAAALLQGYAAAAPLQPAEVAVLPTLLELVWLQEELLWVATTLERSPDEQVDVLNQGRWLSGWVRERHDELVAAWTDIAANQPFLEGSERRRQPQTVPAYAGAEQ
jgi:homoserine kinase type II